MYLRVAAVLLVVFAAVGHSIICYESDNTGLVHEVNNASWSYCALIPPMTSRPVTGRVFGVGPNNDWTEAYDHTFGLKDRYYNILSICILEKYDFRTLSPQFTNHSPEFLFRCVCNYDRCNHANTFSAYINAVEMENQ
uniref:Uncharacterized protein n=1 Tax=Plectus sambesii TaxID=2011161 RepID=A0A914WDS4_9BILA